VREVVRRHAAEAWAFAGGGRCGFRLTFPVADAVEPDGTPAPPAPTGPLFVGAGLVSGCDAGQPLPERPDFYDFSLFDEMARAVPPLDRDRPLEELVCVAFDVETTGLSPDDGDRIVSIAGVRIRRGRVRRGETFDALVHPGRPIPAASARFHGITDAMVASAPPIETVLPAFLRFAEGAVLVGHQVSFDLRFVELAAARLGLPPVATTRPVLDTLLLSEVVHGRLARHGLDAVAARLGVVVRGRHSALGDALATAEIFVRLLPLLAARGIATLGQALDASRRARGPRGLVPPAGEAIP
ncbi:MAG TPA: 3'-5' exonuclease, partial [Thermodesulfobacteriota bacterium]|nr:3'-5' exonuclease [Thermodesulfobacteriota bacterium]